MIRYVRMADPELMLPDRYPVLDALSALCEERPEFAATYPAAWPCLATGEPIGMHSQRLRHPNETSRG